MENYDIEALKISNSFVRVIDALEVINSGMLNLNKIVQVSEITVMLFTDGLC